MARNYVNLAEIMGQVDNARANESNLKRQQQQMDMQDYEYQKALKQDQEQEALKGVYSGAIDSTGDAPKINEQKLIQDLMQRGYSEQALKLQDQFKTRDMQNGKLQNESKSADLKYQMDLTDYSQNSMAGSNPQSWGAIKQDLISKGVKAAESMPDTYDESFKNSFVMDAKSFRAKNGGGDEDNLIIPTPNGLMYFNKKDKKDYGYLDMNGGRVMRAQDDPALRGAVKGAEARAGADYKLNNDIDGMLGTDTQISDMARGGAPVSASPNSMRISPTIQGQRDDKRLQILLAEQQAQGGAGKDQYLDAEIANMQPRGGGIKVPTKAQLARDEAQSKANVELNMKPKIETATATATADTKSAQSAKKGTATLNSMMRYLYKDGVPERDSSNRLIPPKEAMVLGNSVADRTLMKGHEYGFTNNKASNIIGVRRLINSLVLDANNGSLGAGVSNADVEFLQKIQGVINSAQAPEDIYNAIADNEVRFNRVLNLKNTSGQAITPTNPLSLKLPNGQSVTFKNKAMMDAYKKYKGLK